MTVVGEVVVFVKQSSYRRLVLERKDSRIRTLLSSKSPATRHLKATHEDHEATTREVLDALERLGTRCSVRSSRDAAPIHAADLVVTVGGDGTLLLASHHVGPDVPIVGINSAPKTSVGFFCAGVKGTAARTLATALAGGLSRLRLARMQVERNGDVISSRVLNEALFCHASPAATSRYLLQVHSGGREREEDQRSSGLWIGPAAGSTAAQKSAGGDVLPLSSRDLQYVVREPYTPLGEVFRLKKGRVCAGGDITLYNKMHEAKLFLDGHQRAFDVRYGDELVMRVSDESLTILGMEPRSGGRKRRA